MLSLCEAKVRPGQSSRGIGIRPSALAPPAIQRVGLRSVRRRQIVEPTTYARPVRMSTPNIAMYFYPYGVNCHWPHRYALFRRHAHLRDHGAIIARSHAPADAHVAQACPLQHW